MYSCLNIRLQSPSGIKTPMSWMWRIKEKRKTGFTKRSSSPLTDDCNDGANRQKMNNDINCEIIQKTVQPGRRASCKIKRLLKNPSCIVCCMSVDAYYIHCSLMCSNFVKLLRVGFSSVLLSIRLNKFRLTKRIYESAT